jgi:16S rRNA (guanine(966)-N(2))-methyltransferase RsmD
LRELLESKMRVIAGIYRSRAIKSLRGLALRPTSDPLRETVFNILGAAVHGSHFIDLFAGTGAVGIEALSRGAAAVVFIENHGPAATLIHKNLASLGAPPRTVVLAVDVIRGLEMLSPKNKFANTRYDYVYIDPPYASSHDYTRVLNFPGWPYLLSPGCIVIAEHRRTYELPENCGPLERVRVHKQGDAALTFFSYTPTK